MRNFFSFIFLNIFIFVSANVACSKQNQTNISNHNSSDTTTMTATSKRYLALGDSYTIGQSVPSNLNFPSQLVTSLDSQNIKIGNTEIIAVTGWTTIDLQHAIASQNPQGPYDIVTLLIGVNDQYQGLDTGGYRTRFTELLQQSIAFAGNNSSHVFVLSIPDYSVTPYAQNYDTAKIRLQLEEFNAINYEVSQTFKTGYINITPLTEEMKTNATLVAGDGLHPSALEYTQWVNLLAPAVAKVLQ